MTDALIQGQRRKTNLSKVCAVPDLLSSRSPDEYLFWYRWEAGEIAEDIVEEFSPVDVDEPQGPVVDGQSYDAFFTSEEVSDVQQSLEGLRAEEKPPASVALRYYLEFDAYLVPGPFRTGGNWSWGGMGSRAERREPQAFYDYWSQQ
ncbi:hypothetical protein AAD018_016910 [Aestuariibius insulae]|uniref:hypothetical protein n=1 Tax=Aestuariibius insulae TaxID=2058287 RepID=UPI00345F15A9